MAHNEIASHATGPINALPRELLGVVFCHIDRRPLLHIVSLVCKHWRRAALSSITKLKLSYAKLSSPVGPATLAQLRLPSVSIKVKKSTLKEAIIREPLTLHFPPSLTRLHLQLSERISEPLTWLVVPPLRQLHLDRVGAPQAAALLAHCGATLEVLTLETVAEDTFRALAPLSLPALNSLNLRDVSFASLGPFLTRHATQLVSLGLYDVGGTSARIISSLPLTGLHSLALKLVQSFSADDAARAIRAAPNLTALTLCDLEFQLNELPLSELRNLVRYSACPVDRDLTLLSSLPRLRRLCAQPHMAARIFAHGNLLPMLSVLGLPTQDDCTIAFLLRATNLSHLFLRGPILRRYLPAHLPASHFARLRVLHLTPHGGSTFDALAQTLSYFLNLAPRLKVVKLIGCRTPADWTAHLGDVAPLSAVLCALLRRGCMVRVLGYSSETNLALTAAGATLSRALCSALLIAK